MSQIVVRLRNVQKSFNDLEVLRGVDLDVAEGSITVVIGPSGSGKSVLVKHVIGLLKPDAGSIEIDGEDITTLSERRMIDVRKKFGMLFQQSALFDSMNVMENVIFPWLNTPNCLEKRCVRWP